MIDYESFILDALQTAVKVAVGTTTTSPKIKFIGVNFDKPTNAMWWEIVYIPNNKADEFWADGKTYQGILRLVLHCPQNNTGGITPMQEVSRVSTLLKKGSKYVDLTNTVSVQIQDHPNATGVIEQSPELLLPLTVRYSCFKIS